MSTFAQTVFWLSLFLVNACVESQEKLSSEVSDFIQLLVRTDEPSLAEYAKFSGECGGEPELVFALEECRSRGWGIYTKSCVEYTWRRCHIAEQITSLELSWLRKRFSTVGENYRLVSIQTGSEGFEHDLLEVEIGKNKFLLFHNTDPNIPTGFLVGVSKVNDKKITDYLKSQ